MKTYFYEINEPYSAIIKAHNEDEVLEVYEYIVCDVEDKDEFFQELRAISDFKVRKQIARVYHSESEPRLMTLKEQVELFNAKAPCIITMEIP